VRFTVLGSSGTYPTPTNPASSYLVRTNEATIWCDAGHGGFQALAAAIDPADIDAILVSHRHPDHCVDVFAAFHAFAYGPNPIHSIPFFAHPSVIDHLTGFLDAGSGHQIHTVFDFNPIEAAGGFSVADLTMRAVPMDHSVPTFGFGFEAQGRRLFYTADTGPNGSWVEEVGPADLLVSEASLQGDAGDDGYRQHLTAARAGEIASRVGATRLLLTHIPPYLDPLRSVREAETEFGRTVMAAVPGATHEV
jgi:ribonuclease BN (tRNA processing enzyme)